MKNVAIPLHVIGLNIKEIKPRVTDVLEELGIADKSHHLPSELSGGEQQIVSLARAIVKEPIVVLADEPTGNLDPAASLKIMRLLEQINSDGTAVLMATHNYSFVKDRGHRFIEIVEGRVTA